MALGAEKGGTLRIHVQWPPGCPDCRLEISTSEDMSLMEEAKRSRRGKTEIIEKTVPGGVYYLVGRSKSGRHGFSIRVQLRDNEGKDAPVTHHGEVQVCPIYSGDRPRDE